LLLTGDHRQLAAVGAAGGMRLVADTGGSAYELAEVRRFTAPWERRASLRLREGDPAALQEYRKHGRIVDSGTVEQAQAAAERAFLADTLAGRDTLLISDTNEQAARLSAKVRADLVRLGRVEETGVPLGLQGTVAGVGDVVQARRNGWELIGYDGNRRVPINRERYRVLEIRDDGGLRVAPILGDGRDAMPGEPLTLPGSYVAEHVALGYASTVHSAQGLTVDTCHIVATGSTSPAALYVGMSRGRDGSTAYVATRRIPDDAPVGSTQQVEPRDPVALLTTTTETATEEQAALREAARSAAEAATVRTAAERFADVAEQAVAGRTAASLDRLVDEGLLTRRQREQLAADAGMSGLARALRQAEIAGHDPHQVLTDAVAQRHLEDARSLAGVLHHRVVRGVSLEPQGDSYASWVPKVDNQRWRQHLEDLRAAWRALGRAEADRAEAEMTDGQLRVRVRAIRREEAWQPEYVANTLSGTSQAEARHRHTAQIRAAEAAVAGDDAERARLDREAREAAALADNLARRKAQLEEADWVRSLWYAHTAETRAAADRARRELETRGIHPEQTGDETTAEEWLAAHADAERAQDNTSVVRGEEDLADIAVQRERDEHVFDRPDEPAAEVERPEPAPTPPPARADTDDWTRVPTADETAQAIARARAALLELTRRREREEQRARDEQRRADLARWQTEQPATEAVTRQAGRSLDAHDAIVTLERPGL